MKRKLENDLPRMTKEPLLYNAPDGTLVWAWMRWHDRCAPGMLRHMIPPARMDALLKENGFPPLDEKGEPWFLATAATPEEVYEAVGVKPSQETLDALHEQDRFHRKNHKDGVLHRLNHQP